MNVLEADGTERAQNRPGGKNDRRPVNQKMVRAAFGGARKSAPGAGDDLGEDPEIDVIPEDRVPPVDDNAERARQREKERPDDPKRVQRAGGGL